MNTHPLTYQRVRISKTFVHLFIVSVSSTYYGSVVLGDRHEKHKYTNDYIITMFLDAKKILKWSSIIGVMGVMTLVGKLI